MSIEYIYGVCMETGKISNFSFGSKRKKTKQNKKAIIKALGAQCGIQVASNVVSSRLAQKLMTPSKSLSKEEIDIVNKGAQRVLSELTNLSKKGTEILHLSLKDNVSSARDWLYTKFDALYAIAKGENAAFINKIPKCSENRFKELKITPNSVLVNKDKLPLSTFHELGHAYNYHNSAFWKTMQKSRTPATALASLFAMLPALTKDIKAQKGEELTAKEKAFNGIRKASPFLATLSMLPVILEEGKATLRGNDWAKKVFSDNPDLAKKVAKGNKYGFISYVFVAAAIGLSSFVAKKVKDNSDKKNELRFAAQKLDYHQG